MTKLLDHLHINYYINQKTSNFYYMDNRLPDGQNLANINLNYKFEH